MAVPVVAGGGSGGDQQGQSQQQQQQQQQQQDPAMEAFRNFVKLHSYQLESAGLPLHLWRLLFDKLSKEVFDGGEYFEFARVEEEDEEDEGDEGADAETEERQSKIVVVIKEGQSLEPNGDVFLIDHAWATSFHTSRQNLLQVVGALERVSGILDFDLRGFDSKEDAVDALIGSDRLWRALNYYSVGRADGREEASVWYLMDELGSRIQHAGPGNATFAMAPFLFSNSGMAYSILWPLQAVSEGDEVTRDYLPNIAPGPIRDARVCAWWDPDEDIIADCKDAYRALEGRLKEISETLQKEEKASDASSVEEQLLRNLSLSEAQQKKVLVYTNMDIVKTSLQKDSSLFQITEDANRANVLWLFQHIEDYHELADGRQIINQFPDEKHLTCKDLLTEAQYAHFGLLADEFLPRTYNLETQVQEFVGYYLEQKEKSPVKPIVYISKPWALARGIGHYISPNLSLLLRSIETGPRVVSRYLDNPALFQGRKFDLRFMVGLKSVRPLRLSVYRHFLVRFANKPFSLDHFDDYEKHMTVMTFSPFELKEVEDHDFIEQYEKTTKGVAWKDIEERIYGVILKAFTAASLKMNNFPQARALYGIDIILDEEQKPYLLEVNYSPNCDRLVKYKPLFFPELFRELFLSAGDGKEGSVSSSFRSLSSSP